MSVPMPARRETAFSRTEMDAVCEMVVSSSDSVGVAIPQPGLRAKHATLGINPTSHSYSVRVAISRRRYLPFNPLPCPLIYINRYRGKNAIIF